MRSTGTTSTLALGQLPGRDDEEELGYGAWLRNSDQTIIVKFIDLRLMTVENQRLFCEAAKRAASIHRDEEWLLRNLSDLADMVSRVERGSRRCRDPIGSTCCPRRTNGFGPGWPAA